MTIRAFGVCLAVAATVVACSGGGGGGAASQPAPDGGAAGSSSGSPGQSGDGGPASNGQLTAALQNSGRHGDDLLFTVQGSDPAGRTTEVHAKLLDATGAPVVAFDTNWDGAPDAAETRLHFDASTLGQKTFKQTITLPGLYRRFPTIAAAVVALSDASGNQSSPVNPTLVQQPVRKLGDACDPAEVADRCAEGLSCGGKAPTCQAGAPPTLTQVAYFGGANPAELIVGSDPAEDLASIDVHFLDSSGKSLTVDLSGDGTTPPVSSVTLDATGVPGQAFFFENDPVASFTQAVPKISVTAIDVFGKTSAPVVATLATPTVRTNGLTCDPYGFTVCATGYACSPGIPGATNKCGSVQSLQTAKCNAAAAWDKQGVLAAWGMAGGTSLWDPPAGCAPAVEVNRPESVVTLVLDHAVSTLTVSTAVPETDFDTIVYVLPACASQSSEALGCSDDAQGYASTVTLTNVAAGTYTVIVDSGSAQGGHFGLSVSAQ